MNKSVGTSRGDPEVFESIGIFETNDATKCSMSIRLRFAKFAHGFAVDDFETFIKTVVGEENVVALGRLSFPNEWSMTLTSKDVRENLIRLGRVRINYRSCWIYPLSNSEVRGFIHWLPNEVSNLTICHILRNFGDVLFIETRNFTKFTHKIACDSRYFALFLKVGHYKEDIPHFAVVSGKLCLITIRGRQPACFHCRQVGHKKSECKRFREKLSEYCLRKPENPVKREKRGRRHKAKTDGKPRSGLKAVTDQLSAEKEPDDLTEKTSLEESSSPGVDSKVPNEETQSKAKKKKSRRKKNKNKTDEQHASDNSSEATVDGNCAKKADKTGDDENIPVEIAAGLDEGRISDAEVLLEEKNILTCNSGSVEELCQTLFKLSTEEEECVPLKESTLEEDTCVKIDFVEKENVEMKEIDFLSHSEDYNKKNAENIKIDSPQIGKELKKEMCSFEIMSKEEKHAPQKCVEEKGIQVDFAEKEHVSAPTEDKSTILDTKEVDLKIENNSEKLKPQINEIVCSFMLQFTEALCQAGVTNLNEIQHKLHAFADTVLTTSKNLVLTELKNNKREEHAAKVGDPDHTKSNKKKKKKGKNNN